jgi:hypothetical protein
MATEKKERVMSPKGFLQKTTQKAAGSATTFLATWRDYLLNSEVAYLTASIIQKVDDGSIMPTPALQAVKDALVAHIVQVDLLKAEASMIEKSSKSAKGGKGSKKFSARIIDGNGETCTRVKDNGETEELWKSCDLPQQAARWTDIRLFDGAPDWSGIIYQENITYELIGRVQSMGRILAKGKTPVMHVQKSTGSLSFGVKAKQSHCSFSKG